MDGRTRLNVIFFIFSLEQQMPMVFSRKLKQNQIKVEGKVRSQIYSRIDKRKKEFAKKFGFLKHPNKSIELRNLLKFFSDYFQQSNKKGDSVVPIRDQFSDETISFPVSFVQIMKNLYKSQLSNDQMSNFKFQFDQNTAKYILIQRNFFQYYRLKETEYRLNQQNLTLSEINQDTPQKPLLKSNKSFSRIKSIETEFNSQLLKNSSIFQGLIDEQTTSGTISVFSPNNINNQSTEQDNLVLRKFNSIIFNPGNNDK